MNTTGRGAGRTSKTATANPLKAIRRVLVALCLVAIGILIARMFLSIALPGTAGVWETSALLLVFVTTLVSLAATLPAQNVALAATIIGVIGGGVHALGGLTGIPFGTIIFTAGSAPILFNALPWFMPFLWVIVILNSRGVARLILRPWRKLRAYGYWLIGLTAVLTLIFVLGWEPFAVRVGHFWLWSPSRLAVDWYGTPLSDFLGWLVTSLLILAFSTPALMKKKPTKSGVEYDSLILWLAINLLFMAGSVSQHLLAASVVTAGACLLVIAFAVRGARW